MVISLPLPVDTLSQKGCVTLTRSHKENSCFSICLVRENQRCRLLVHWTVPVSQVNDESLEPIYRLKTTKSKRYYFPNNIIMHFTTTVPLYVLKWKTHEFLSIDNNSSFKHSSQGCVSRYNDTMTDRTYPTTCPSPRKKDFREPSV